MSIREKDRNELFSVPWENVSENRINELGQKRIESFDKSVNRMNADLMVLRQNNYTAPKYYHDLSKDMCEYWMDSANYSDIQRKNTAVTIAEETYVLDREKARTYYDTNIAGQIFAPVTRPLSRFKWDVKHYLIQKVANVAKFSRDFDKPRMVKLKTSSQLDKGTGWYLGYQISRWQLLENQGELFDLQFETMLEAAFQMGRLAHEHILTGSTVEHGGTDDMGEAGSGMALTGFVNNGSVQSFTLSTPSTYLNIYKGFRDALADLKKVYASDNVVGIVTAGLIDQAERNVHTYLDQTELELIKKRLGNRIKQLWICEQLTGAAITAATQKAFFIKLDPRLMSRLIVLPLQTLPSEKKNWRDDISEVMLAADVLRYQKYDTTENAFPATAAASLTTTSIGIDNNGRFW